jgi:CubicO group peptidase (beta-lactamase class C family)
MTDADLAGFLAVVEGDPRLEPHSLLVLHRGEPVHEAYWRPWSATDRQLVYSVSKTLTGSAIGIMIGEGRLELGSRLCDLVGAGEVGPRMAEVTVHHLLSMSTGHDPAQVDGLDLHATPDPLAAFLRLEPAGEVGSAHAYSNPASWVLGELVRRLTGESLLGYLGPRLLAPLDLDPTWDVDRRGRELGYSGVHLTTRELARLGEVYRCGGRWRGRRLIPSDFVARASSRQVATTHEFPEWRYGYGYQVWLNREGFRLDGAFGQYALVLPERELVIALTSAQAAGSQPLLDAVFTHLVGDDRGMADRGDGTGGVPRPLERAVRPLPDDGQGSAWQFAGTVPLEAGLAPDVAEPAAPRLADVSLVRSGTGWELALSADGDHQHWRVPRAGEWFRTELRTGNRSVPVALSVGAVHGVARVLVSLTDSPHTFVLEIREATAGAAWRTVPLHAPRMADLVAR